MTAEHGPNKDVAQVSSIAASRSRGTGENSEFTNLQVAKMDGVQLDGGKNHTGIQADL